MYFKVRRMVDSVVALIMIVVLFPLMIALAIWIKTDSEGPIIFKQKRIPYDMYKFRSMVQNAQNMGTGVFCFEGDPRVTKSGAFLRKTSLDELPQLLNIIKGEMSFVGPRPPVVGFFPEYSDLDEQYKIRFSVLPGITGLAQCIGRNELTWGEKVKYDNLYVAKVNKYGFFYDLKIWFLTIKRVFLMKDIAETQANKQKSQEELMQMVKRNEDN